MCIRRTKEKWWTVDSPSVTTIPRARAQAPSAARVAPPVRRMGATVPLPRRLVADGSAVGDANVASDRDADGRRGGRHLLRGPC